MLAQSSRFLAFRCLEPAVLDLTRLRPLTEIVSQSLKILEEVGYEVIRQQDLLPEEKGKKVTEKEKELIKSADLIVRLYRGDAQSDEAAFEGTIATIKYNKPLVTLIAPGFTEEDLPSCLLTYSKRIIRLDKIDVEEIKKYYPLD